MFGKTTFLEYLHTKDIFENEDFPKEFNKDADWLNENYEDIHDFLKDIVGCGVLVQSMSKKKNGNIEVIMDALGNSLLDTKNDTETLGYSTLIINGVLNVLLKINHPILMKEQGKLELWIFPDNFKTDLLLKED